MELSGSLSVLRRRAFVAAGLAGLLCAASGVRAHQPVMVHDFVPGQDPAAPAAQPAQQDPLKFNHDGTLMIIWDVKPERVPDFEAVWQLLKSSLAKSEKPELREFGQTITISTLVTPGGAGPKIYVFTLSPVSKTFSYNPVTLLYETLKAPPADPAVATPPASPPGTFSYDEATEVYKRFEGSYNSINPWPLQKMPW